MSTAKKALKGTLFVAVNSYISLFIYFISGIALARILGPADFGLFRISLFFADLFGRFREFGLDKALIHKQGDMTTAYRTHFLLQFFLSGLTVILIIISYPWLNHFYSGISWYILLITLAYVFQSLGSTQRVFLEKNLIFEKTAAVDIISLFLSSLLSVIMALRGYGSASLVIGYAVNYLIGSALLWFLRPWRVKFSDLFIINWSDVRWFMKFGTFLFFGGLTTFVLYKYNDFVLGTFLSISALGFYSRAFNYAQIPTSLITSIISKVALPTYSSLQSDRQKLSQAFAIVLKSIVRISLPLSILLFLVSREFTGFILGEKWLPMVPIFRILLIYGVLRSILDDLGELFTALGKPRIVSSYLFIQALLTLPVAPLLSLALGAEGAALSLSLVLLIGVIFAYFHVSREVDFKPVAVFLPTVSASFLSLLLFFPLSLFIHFNYLINLLTKGLLFVLIYLFFASVIDGRSFLRDLKFIIGHWRAPTKEAAVGAGGVAEI